MEQETQPSPDRVGTVATLTVAALASGLGFVLTGGSAFRSRGATMSMQLKYQQQKAALVQAAAECEAEDSDGGRCNEKVD